MLERLRILPLAATFVLAIAGAGRLAQAQAQDLDASGDVDEPRLRPMVSITDEQFEQFLFGCQRDALTARKLLESRLKSRIEYIQSLHGITPEGRAKLDLAGRGDIKRFFDRVEEARRKVRVGPLNRIQLERALEELHRLCRHYESGIFDDESMSAKALKRILNERFLTQAGKDRWGKVITLHHARVEWVVSSLQKSLMLSDPQRQRVLNLLLAETRPPKTFGPLDYFGIVYQASELPEADLRPIFDDTQWRELRREFENARRLEAMLKANGYLPEPGVASDRAEEKATTRGNAPAAADRPRLN